MTKLATDDEMAERLFALASGEVPPQFKTHAQYAQGIHAYRNALMCAAAARLRASTPSPASSSDAKHVLKLCAERFREYEAIHMAKGSIEGDAKARSNASMAELCENVLANLPSPHGAASSSEIAEIKARAMAGYESGVLAVEDIATLLSEIDTLLSKLAELEGKAP